MKVQFVEVGRNKRSWDAEMKAPLTEAALRRQVKTQGQILSSEIEFEYDEAAGEGAIYVGSFRRVGTFKIAEAQHTHRAARGRE